MQAQGADSAESQAHKAGSDTGAAVTKQNSRKEEHGTGKGNVRA